jgi:16S rRNA processing protein RimM
VGGTLLEVGRVDRAHGLRGEVIVSLVTNRLERVAPGAVLVAAQSQGEPERELTVLASSPHQGRHIVTFAGVSTREEAEQLHGRLLSAPPIPGGGDLYVHELIGLEVVDSAGGRHGAVTAVEANPASDLLVVDGRFYVPLRFVVEQREGELLVEVPDGLFE